MGSYLDITGRLDDRTHWYICGPDVGLRAAAYHELREHLVTRAGRVLRLDGANTTPEQLRDLLLTEPEPWEDGPLLVVLDHAEAVDLSFLMEERPADLSAMLLACGTENKAPEAERRYLHFFRRQTARMVRCVSPGQASRGRIQRWVQIQARCYADTADALVKHSGGSTMWLADAVRRLRAVGIGEGLRPDHVPMLCGPPGDAGLADALRDGDKALAARSVPGPAAAPRVLAELERLVLTGALVYEVQKNVGWAGRLLVSRTGLSTQELGILRARINMFDRHATERRLTVLARQSERAARGDRYAWLSIVAAW